MQEFPKPKINFEKPAETRPPAELNESETQIFSPSPDIADLAASDRQTSAAKIAAIRQELRGDDSIAQELELIARDPELAALYRDIIENGDLESLKTKSAAQVAELSQRYLGNFSLLKLPERLRKTNKLKLFSKFVNGLTPIRADSQSYDGEFKSPERTGNLYSYGPQDTVAHAEQFVYGSFAEFAHLMARNLPQYRLDQTDIAPRAQIIMNDVANVIARTEPGQSFMKKYLTNTFDWENGKKILALYLASVFDTPEQAQNMIDSAGGNPMAAQHWDEGNSLRYYDPELSSHSDEEYSRQRAKEIEQSEIFLERMRNILADTGIEPPLSIEIRVKDTAKITV